MQSPFNEPLEILQVLEDNGFEAYFVGGSVRDHILGRKIGDVDIATSASPHEVRVLFPRTIDVGIEHGTVVVLLNDTPYEVTTFRTEGEYEDYRRPSEVTFIQSLEEDLKRRDFTVNAIAMSRTGKIIDPFDGQGDLRKKLIKCVGKAHERFNEDALRMMRAIRFVSQLTFHLESNTRSAIIDLAHFIQQVSIERIRIEFEKMFLGENINTALEILVQTRIPFFLPSMKNRQKQLVNLLEYKWNSLNKREEIWSLLCILLDFKENERKDFLKGWKLPNKLVDHVLINVKVFNEIKTPNWSNYALYTYGIARIIEIEKLKAVKFHLEEDVTKRTNLEAKYNQLPIHSRKDMVITGHDLINWTGNPPGPWVSKTLQNLEKAIIGNEIKNDREEIKEWLLSCNLT